MSSIALVLPGNTFHSNQQSDRIAAMDKERCGLPVFREYGIPAIAFFQRLDLSMKPWLRDEMAVKGSIEWGNSTFSHSLVPLFGSWREQTNYVLGTVPVTFFPEFFVPLPMQIPTTFTLVLAGQSSLYSAFTDSRELMGQDLQVQDYPAEAHAIIFGGKVGILMREEWYAPLLGAFFHFQRFPIKGSDPDGRDRLNELVEEIRKIANDKHDRVVVTPLDLEAPWIGSNFGAQVWEILFEELKRQGLTDVFVPLSGSLKRFAQEAVPASRPHRDLTKWTSQEVQLQHMFAIKELETRSFVEVDLKMIASGSDVFSAWNSKIREKKQKIMLTAATPLGQNVRIPISFNQSVIDVQFAAFKALKNGKSFAAELRSLKHQDYFVGLAIKMAEDHGW